MDSFKGKTAFVTGGTSGIGRAAAVAFARAGTSVAVVGRRAAEGQKSLDLLRDVGGDGIFITVDLAREADVIRAIEQASARFGQIDFAANCAGDEKQGRRDLNVTSVAARKPTPELVSTTRAKAPPRC